MVATGGEVSTIWAELEKHFCDWYYLPDLEALRISLASVAAHYNQESDPVWLFVIGPASSGKTSIVINSLAMLPNTHVMGELSANTLLSGYVGSSHPSALHQIGSGILLFKDFTTFLSQTEQDQIKIASQLREVYDGSHNKRTGTGEELAWHGKITIVAAVTPEIERKWQTMRTLGERFLQVRSERRDGLEAARWARRQSGNQHIIKSRAQTLISRLFGAGFGKLPPLSTAQEIRIDALAELACCARAHVTRDSRGSRDIIGTVEPEESPRFAKALDLLCRNHASLFHHPSIEEQDMQVAHRVAWDCIPAPRAALLKVIPLHLSIGFQEMCERAGINDSTARWNADELEAIGILKIDRNGDFGNRCEFTPRFNHVVSSTLLKPEKAS